MPKFEKFAYLTNVEGDQILLTREPSSDDRPEIDQDDIYIRMYTDNSVVELSLQGLTLDRDLDKREWPSVEALFTDPRYERCLRELAVAAHADILKIDRGLAEKENANG